MNSARRELKGQKAGYDMGLLSILRQAIIRSSGVIVLMTRMGMEVVLAHPEGYEVMPEVEEVARKNAEKSGGSFRVSHDMADAFKDADIVYPKSWLHLQLWKREPTCMLKAIPMASRLLRKNC